MSGARLCFNHGKSRSQVGHEKRLGFRRIWATCLREDPASECVLRKVRKEGFLIENLKIHGVWKSSTPCSSKNGTAPPFAVHREPRQNQFSMFQQDERFPEGRSVDTLQQPDMRDESSEVAPVAALPVRAGLAFEPQIDDCESLYLADLVTITCLMCGWHVNMNTASGRPKGSASWGCRRHPWDRRVITIA